jgi:hypothetical protein
VGSGLVRCGALLHSLTSYRPARLQVLLAAALIAVMALIGITVLVLNSPVAGVHAHLEVPNSDHVRVLEPVTVRFDQPVDLTRTRVTFDLNAGFEVTKKSDRLIVTPLNPGWTADKRYTLLLGDVPNNQHSATLHGWRTTFTTQPRVGIAGLTVDGKPAPDPANVSMRQTSKLAIAFTTAMKPATVTVNISGQPLPPDRLQWAANGESVTLGVLPYPYKPFTVSVGDGATSSQGDPLTSKLEATVTAQALLPSNPSSNIGPNFQTQPPVEIVVENSGPAKPQTGLQDADIVYEYLSEYGIGRMTAIYFNKPPGLVGPVRSCRMINPYLGFSFGGETMCSGASVGTLHYMFYDPYLVPGSINDFDRGNHFFRVNFKAAPHNVYTTGDDAVRLRDDWHLPPPNYQVDPPHADIDFPQAADGSPSVPQHGVSWAYDASIKQYLRTDQGAPFVDDQYHTQVHAKNVIVMHVGSHDAGWVEDDNGGAHSVWYDMLGTGPADIWSNGTAVHATWHMGAGGPQPFYDNHQPVWFTDEQGGVIELNSGLTWVHVVGSGQ